MQTYRRSEAELKAANTVILKLSNDQVAPLFSALVSTYRHPEVTAQLADDNFVVSGSNVRRDGSVDTARWNSYVLAMPAKKPATAVAKPWVYFNESPFYRLKRLVHGSPKLAPASQHRGTCNIEFVLNPQEQQLLAGGYQLMLFSGVYNEKEASKPVHIRFPLPMELYFNKTQVTLNFRGIKNREGTARPANLTDLVRQPPMNNALEVVYAFQTKTFLLYCYIVETVSPEALFAKILKDAPRILKQATISQLKKEFEESQNNDDIMELTTKISLRCPLSYMRMKVPARSERCQHVQCFDCLSFIQSQSQVTTWTCPICNIPLKLKDLMVSDYMVDILKVTDEAVDNVEILHDGGWKAIFEEEEEPKPKKKQDVKFEEGDVVPSEVEVITLDSESEDEPGPEPQALTAQQQEKQQEKQQQQQQHEKSQTVREPELFELMNLATEEELGQMEDLLQHDGNLADLMTPVHGFDGLGDIGDRVDPSLAGYAVNANGPSLQEGSSLQEGRNLQGSHDGVRSNIAQSNGVQAAQSSGDQPSGVQSNGVQSNGIQNDSNLESYSINGTSINAPHGTPITASHGANASRGTNSSHETNADLPIDASNESNANLISNDNIISANTISPNGISPNAISANLTGPISDLGPIWSESTLNHRKRTATENFTPTKKPTHDPGPAVPPHKHIASASVSPVTSPDELTKPAKNSVSWPSGLERNSVMGAYSSSKIPDGMRDFFQQELQKQPSEPVYSSWNARANQEIGRSNTVNYSPSRFTANTAPLPPPHTGNLFSRKSVLKSTQPRKYPPSGVSQSRRNSDVIDLTEDSE